MEKAEIFSVSTYRCSFHLKAKASLAIAYLWLQLSYAYTRILGVYKSLKILNIQLFKAKIKRNFDVCCFSVKKLKNKKPFYF